MDLLFVIDPIETFKISKDTTYVMMREAQRRGCDVWICQPQHLFWQEGSGVRAQVQQIVLQEPDEKQGWWRQEQSKESLLAEFAAVLMRKDPPFDDEFFYTTQLLSQAQREGACVLNHANALREHPEKLAILEFPELIAPTLVTRESARIREFHRQHGDIILKPLDGMGGMGIFRVGMDGLNLGSIIETLNKGGASTVMAQRYLSEIKQGDKRVLLINGEAVPFALARIPQGNEIRGNMAVGGKAVAQPLSERDRKIANYIGPILAARGLLLVGLDIIGTSVTEINVTSPTGFQEIQRQTGFDVAAMYLDAVQECVLEKTKRLL